MEEATSETSHARSEVVLGIVGIRAEALRESLVNLLAAELATARLSLVERPPSRELAGWAAEVVGSEHTLLAILLDARNDQDWRLIVIDAARGRAIVRHLPGGIQQDAATIEAVVSIASSAAGALLEGLEVASSPLAAVVGASPVRTKEPRRAVASGVDDSAPRARPRSFLHGSVSVSAATFSPEVVTTNGLALALGVDWRGQLEARAFGTLFWPAKLETPFGAFGVSRALFGAAAGPVLKLPTFSLVPEAGIVAERLRRAETTPAAGVIASQARALYRVGGVVAVRLRVPIIRPLSVELVTGAAYFGRRVQFSTSGPAASQLVGVWPLTAFAQLGLDVATR